MDPISLVVTALVAGLIAGITDTAKSAINDTYAAIRTRLSKKIENKPEAQEALESLEKKPDSEGRQAVLKEELQGVGIDDDSELLSLARSMIEKADKQGIKYNITITDAHGFVIGDGAKVTQNFNKPKKK